MQKAVIFAAGRGFWNGAFRIQPAGTPDWLMEKAERKKKQ